jgi:hypothetical protein
MAFVPPGNQKPAPVADAVRFPTARLLCPFGEELWGRSCEARLFSAHRAPLSRLAEQTRRLSAC